MKSYKSIISVLTVIAFCVLTSCQSREEKVINRLNNLSEQIEEDGKNFDAKGWEDAIKKLDKIHEDMQDCKFTTEQLQEVGRTEGRLYAIIAKESAKVLGQGFSDAIQQFGSFAKGFKEGAEENFDEDAIEDALDKISNAFKSVEDEWDE